MIDEICKNSWSMVSVDGHGRYKLFNMWYIFQNTGLTFLDITLSDIIDGSLGDIKGRAVNDIFCEPEVRYGWDEGSKTYTKFIRVTDTDKSTFSTAYVQSSEPMLDADKENTWNACRKLFVYYGVKNPNPALLTTCEWIQDDDTALTYLQNWLVWQGADPYSTNNDISERREINFSVPYEFAVENNIDIGAGIRIAVPQYESLGDLYGVINKVNYQLQIKDPKVACTAFVKVVAVSEFGNIIETGDNDDNIIETGTNIVNDYEGNNYQTIIIGDQEWTVENWKSTKYNDGTDIPNVTDDSAWAALNTPAYCYYNNDPENAADGYGALYNYYAVSQSNFAPAGWRVPTEADFDTLEQYLIDNGYNWDETTTGNKIAKSVSSNGGEWTASGTAGNIGNDQSTNNTSGFNAKPTGRRRPDNGAFEIRGGYTYYWNANNGGKTLQYNYPSFDTNGTLLSDYGIPVRLIRDTAPVIIDNIIEQGE
jgi:uncharacterized protein (TIGR02145 family)